MIESARKKKMHGHLHENKNRLYFNKTPQELHFPCAYKTAYGLK